MLQTKNSYAVSFSELPKRTDKYVAIVTGGSRGIGFEVVKMLMASQMHVIMIGVFFELSFKCFYFPV